MKLVIFYTIKNSSERCTPKNYSNGKIKWKEVYLIIDMSWDCIPYYMIKGSLIYKHVGFKVIIKGVTFCMYFYESTCYLTLN